MEWLKKNNFIIKHLAAGLSVLALLCICIIYFGYSAIPNKFQGDAFRTCKDFTENRSYHLKQYILENINNAKIWAENKKGSFFDTRWFAVSYYEHDGREWILKDFKMNSFALDIYKITPSEYIKMEQNLIAPHSRSEQIHIQSSQIQDFSIFIIDSTNSLPQISKNHMLRISMFSDLITAQLNTNKECTLSLLDSRGYFLLSDKKDFQDEILEQIQLNNLETNTNNNSNIQVVRTTASTILTKKLLKNLSIITEVNSNRHLLSKAFAQLIAINIGLAIILFLLFTKIIRQKFQLRIQYFLNNIQKLSKNESFSFDMSKVDELSILDEEISKINEKKRTS